MLMFLFCFLTIFGQHHRWRTLAISTKSLTCFMQHALGISCALASVPSSAMLLTSGERWKEEGRRTRKRRTTLQMWLSPPFSTFILVSILHQHYSSFFCAASNKGSSLSSLCSSCDISPSLLFFHHHIIIFIIILPWWGLDMALTTALYVSTLTFISVIWYHYQHKLPFLFLVR